MPKNSDSVGITAPSDGNQLSVISNDREEIRFTDDNYTADMPRGIGEAYLMDTGCPGPAVYKLPGDPDTYDREIVYDVKDDTIIVEVHIEHWDDEEEKNRLVTTKTGRWEYEQAGWAARRLYSECGVTLD